MKQKSLKAILLFALVSFFFSCNNEQLSNDILPTNKVNQPKKVPAIAALPSTVIATWINVWNGSTESWWIPDNYHGVQVLVNGTWQSINHNDATHRAQYLADIQTAGINTIIVDLSNGAGNNAGKAYQQLCYANGMKICVAMNTTSTTAFESSCGTVFTYWSNRADGTGVAYLRDSSTPAKPIIVCYMTKSMYDACVASTGPNRSKFNLVWASGETSLVDKWGWQLEPWVGPMNSTNAMYATPATKWGANNQGSWRKSLAYFDFTMLAIKANNPYYAIIGSYDDLSERNGWIKNCNTTNSDFGEGTKMKDIYGNISNTVYYNRVKEFVTTGTLTTYNSGGLINDGAYTMQNVSYQKKFGCIRPSTSPVDVGATLKFNQELTTEMEKYYWFYHLGNNEYRIVKLTSGLSLAASGTSVVLAYDTNLTTQRWKLQLISGKYVLTNMSTNTSMNFAAITDGTPMNLVTTNTASTKQQFILTAVANRIIN